MNKETGKKKKILEKNPGKYERIWFFAAAAQAAQCTQDTMFRFTQNELV